MQRIIYVCISGLKTKTNQPTSKPTKILLLASIHRLTSECKQWESENYNIILMYLWASENHSSQQRKLSFIFFSCLSVRQYKSFSQENRFSFYKLSLIVILASVLYQNPHCIYKVPLTSQHDIEKSPMPHHVDNITQILQIVRAAICWMLAGNRLSDSGVVPRPLLPVRNKSKSANFNRAFHNLIKNLKDPSVSGFSNNHGWGKL